MISVRVGGDGQLQTGAASPEYAEHQRLRTREAQEASRAWDEAGRRLAELRALERAPEIHLVAVPGSDEPWAVRRGGFSDLVLCALRSGRDAQGHLALEQSEEVAGFVAAVLSVFVVRGAQDTRLLFDDLGSAREYVEDAAPAVAETVARLFYAAVELNPEIWPEGEAGAKKVCAALRTGAVMGEGCDNTP